jgi:hypothetical protein
MRPGKRHQARGAERGCDRVEIVAPTDEGGERLRRAAETSGGAAGGERGDMRGKGAAVRQLELA